MTVGEFKQIFENQPKENSILFLSEYVSGDSTERTYKTVDLLIDTDSFDYEINGEVIVSGSDNDRTIADADSFSVVLDGQKHSATILEKEKGFRRIISSSGTNNYALFYGDPYYYLKFTPITFTVTTSDLAGDLYYTKEGNEIELSNVFFNSDQLSIDFRTSDYNALDNNADRTIKHQYKQKVDRTVKQVNPVNLDAILSDVAQKAEVQESNYSLTGLKNSKYDGSTTSEEDYGESPVLGLIEFEGATYPVNNNLSASTEELTKQDNFICSQSAEDRPVDVFYFSTNREPSKEVQAQGGQHSLLPSLTTTRIYFSGSKLGDTDIADSFPGAHYDSQSLSVSAFLDIKADDVLALSFFHAPGDTSIYENLLVTSVEYKSESLGGSVTETTASFERNYLNRYDTNTTLTDWSDSNFISIHKYTADTIYKVENNKPYRITNKKLYLRDSGEIYYVDERGRVVAKSREC